MFTAPTLVRFCKPVSRNADRGSRVPQSRDFCAEVAAGRCRRVAPARPGPARRFRPPGPQGINAAGRQSHRPLHLANGPKLLSPSAMPENLMRTTRRPPPHAPASPQLLQGNGQPRGAAPIQRHQSLKSLRPGSGALLLEQQA